MTLNQTCTEIFSILKNNAVAITEFFDLRTKAAVTQDLSKRKTNRLLNFFRVKNKN